MATPNSAAGFERQRGHQLRAAVGIVLLFALSAFSVLSADTTNSVEKLAALRSERAFQAAHERFQKETNSADAAWQFGRACFDRADFSTNNAQRAEFANQGIAACQLAATIAPKLAPARYYLALNLGQLARTKRFSALHLLDEMEAAFSATIALDASYYYAGAHRSIGLLYQDAPGWPLSLGSRARARQHLEKAAQLCPDYPDNRLCLLEAYLHWGEKKKVQADFAAVETVLKNARLKLTGDDWALSWQDWEARWQKIKSQAGNRNQRAGSRNQ